jgi:O-antigen ligase
VLLGAAAILFVYEVVSTSSRGGLLAIPLAVAVLALFAGGKAIVRAVCLAVVAGWFASRSGALAPILNSLNAARSGSDASLNQRLSVWSSYGNTSTFEDFFGRGFGGYNPKAFAGQAGLNIDNAAAVAATVDSAFLKMYLECGFVGLAVIAILLLSAMAALLGARKTGVAPRVVVGGVAAALVVLVWRSVSVDAFDINPYNLFWPMLLGMSSHLGQKAHRLRRIKALDGIAARH